MPVLSVLNPLHLLAHSKRVDWGTGSQGVILALGQAWVSVVMGIEIGVGAGEEMEEVCHNG